MRILIVDELCYPQLGGQQVRFKELAEEWVSFGHEVIIVAMDHIGGLPKSETINGVTYNRIIEDSDYYKSGAFGRKVSSIIKFSFKLKPYFKQNWDIIIFNQFPMLPEFFYKFFYKNRAKTAIDFVEHRDSLLWKIINKMIINCADKVVCISNHVKMCASLYRKDNLFVIPSLVDTKCNISKTKDNYLFLGRLEYHKHPEDAIEAVLAYNKKYMQYKRLDVVGGGGILDNLKAKYLDNPSIIFHGSLDEVKKKSIMETARILILPSEREGLPKVVIEAMSYGIPTVTTDYPGNGTQFFVKEESIGAVALPNISDLADKIHLIESNYHQYERTCNDIKGNFDLTFNSRKYLELFNL